MINLPKLALSVRQPWAYAIVHAGKDIENRDWRELNPGLRFRGPVAIHASAGMTRDEYESAAQTIEEITGKPCPPPCDLLRGGIIGSVVVADIIRARDVRGDPQWLSPWFFGPLGLVLKQPVPCQFIPCKGALGFFAWEPGDPEDVPKPARWMLQQEPELLPGIDEKRGSLL